MEVPMAALSLLFRTLVHRKKVPKIRSFVEQKRDQYENDRTWMSFVGYFPHVTDVHQRRAVVRDYLTGVAEKIEASSVEWNIKEAEALIRPELETCPDLIDEAFLSILALWTQMERKGYLSLWSRDHYLKRIVAIDRVFHMELSEKAVDVSAAFLLRYLVDTVPSFEENQTFWTDILTTLMILRRSWRKDAELAVELEQLAYTIAYQRPDLAFIVLRERDSTA